MSIQPENKKRSNESSLRKKSDRQKEKNNGSGGLNRRRSHQLTRASRIHASTQRFTLELCGTDLKRLLTGGQKIFFSLVYDRARLTSREAAKLAALKTERPEIDARGTSRLNEKPRSRQQVPEKAQTTQKHPHPSQMQPSQVNHPSTHTIEARTTIYIHVHLYKVYCSPKENSTACV